MKKENGAKSGTANSGRNPTRYSLLATRFPSLTSRSSLFASRSGYVALVTTLIVIVVMLAMVFTISLTSYMGRVDVSLSSYQEQSRGLAQACLETARYRLVQNPAYAGNETVTVASSTCRIVSVTASSSQKIVLTQGQFQQSYSNLRTTLNSGDLSLVGTEELKNF
ncbi:MAG: hypothetical protein HY978_02150 [Candidatus Liptonbacteria bacterium]|nr:hypothetical protein [Candidatus Liptonbacteria bacterium]